MTKVEISEEMHPICVTREGYRETAVCFLSKNKPFIDNTYPLSKGDKDALKCINKELENRRIEAILKKWSTADNLQRKNHIKQSANREKAHVYSGFLLSLLDISLIAAQISFALMAVLTLGWMG